MNVQYSAQIRQKWRVQTEKPVFMIDHIVPCEEVLAMCHMCEHWTQNDLWMSHNLPAK